MRSADISRNTLETQISISLSLEERKPVSISTGCGFLDHMLTLFAAHGGFSLSVSCKGDIDVDYHHTTEDLGICLGQAFKEALGDKAGIRRYGSLILPMDETLILCAADVSGRSWLSYEVTLPTQKVGDFDTELVKEFWLGFVRASGMTLHIRMLSGENSHHILEGIFKAAARSIADAVRPDPSLGDAVPSTKGTI